MIIKMQTGFSTLPDWISNVWCCRESGKIMPVRPFSGASMTQAHNVTADATLDAPGLLCPLPVLKARRALKPLAPGAILEVVPPDPGATKDFEHFCATTGCELLEASEQPGGVLRFVMRKPG